MIPSSGIRLAYPNIDEIYARFAELGGLGTHLGGLLLLYDGVDCDGISTVMAANVAGAASLGIEPDGAIAKQALRAGVCDFVVNSLDEALRILKNEIRQRKAVSVIVTDEPGATFAEIVARGVQPDILTVPIPQLIQRGSKLLSRGSRNSSSEMLPVTWSVQREPVRWLPLLDALAVGILNRDCMNRDWRVRWLEASPRYLGRVYAGQRYLRMSSSEADCFLGTVQEAVKDGRVQVAVEVVRDGETTLIES